MKSQRNEVDIKSPCPCDSGKSYGRCCKKKDFRWVKDKRGSLYRELPLTSDVIDVLERQRAEFHWIFGRQPRSGDRIFMTLFPLTVEDMEEVIQDVLEAAEVRPELLHAARKTGIVVTEENQDFIPDVQLKEWDEAVNEYFELQKDPPTQSPADQALDMVLEEFVRLPLIFAIVIEKDGSGAARRRRLRDELTEFRRDYSLFCATRSLKTLRAIRLLLDNNLGEYTLALVRSIYENYLNMVFLQQETEKMFTVLNAQIGLEIGTHEHLMKNNGTRDARNIVDKKSKRVTPSYITTRRMAESSPFLVDARLHDVMYEFLSRYTHPHPLLLQHYVDSEGFIATRREMITEAYLFAHVIAVLTLDTLLNVHLRRDSERDIRRYLRRAKSRLLRLFEFIGHDDATALFRDRLAFVLSDQPIVSDAV